MWEGYLYAHQRAQNNELRPFGSSLLLTDPGGCFVLDTERANSRFGLLSDDQ